MSDEQRTNESTVLAAILSILPDAELGQDNDGQIVVYTGLREVEFTSTPIYAGPFNPPAKSLPPVPEGYERWIVLNDDETFGSLVDSKIFDARLDLDYDGDTVFIDRPEGLDFVASFGPEGLV